MRPIAVATLSLSLLVLTGCAGISRFETTAATTSSIKGLQGRVHGGRQPISGANVYLFAASHRVTIGTPTPSVGLMNSVSGGDFPTAFDPTLNAYYVTTDSNGNFGITGEYSCNAGDQVYLYVLGGDAGAGNNPYSTLMAVLGTCPGSGDQFASIYPFVAINEVTTVAAAYALAGFAVDPLTISANLTDQGLLGLSNAFATAANLADITSAGPALATTPTSGGIVPQAEINTLANAVAACINSGGNASADIVHSIPATYSASCSTLLSAAVTTNGVAATDTADALINLAHNPSAGGQSNVTAIYDLAPGIGAAFQPALTVSVPPTDFTIAISYPAGNLAHAGNAALAIDGSGNVWTTNYIAGAVTEISPLGVVLSGANGFTDGGMNNPQQLAFDTNGRLWIANNGGSGISELNADGSAVTNSPFTPNSGGSSYPLTGALGIAVDASNQVWVSSVNAGSVNVLANSSGLCMAAGCAPFALTGAQQIALDTTSGAWTSSNAANCLTDVSYNASNTPPMSASTNFCQADFNGSTGIAIDSNGTKWVAESSGPQITSVDTSGNINSYPAGGQPDGGLNGPNGVAIDGGGNIWVANLGAGSGVSVSEFTNAGTPLSPPSTSAPSIGGFQSTNTNLLAVGDVAVDPSGNVWMSDYNTIYLTELVGAAVPVATPIVAGVAAGMLGTQP